MKVSNKQRRGKKCQLSRDVYLMMLLFKRTQEYQEYMIFAGKGPFNDNPGKEWFLYVSSSSHRLNLNGVALVWMKKNDYMNLVSVYYISMFFFLHFLDEKYSDKWPLYRNMIQYSAIYITVCTAG